MIIEKRLHWTQRIALVRHNLHSASRTGDFSFFKNVQAHSLVEGVDHLAALTDALGDAADQVLASLDNYNSVIAYVHEDAFKNVYESVKTGVREQSGSYDDRRAIYSVDATQQKEKAEKAIDKMINSAITMISAQPSTCQDEAANVWIIGTTFVADAMQVCQIEIDKMEGYMEDFIRLENSWSTVQSATVAAIGALKGIYTLMAPSEVAEKVIKSEQTQQTESGVKSMLRRMSTALTSSSMNQTPPSRRQSVLSISSHSPSYGFHNSDNQHQANGFGSHVSNAPTFSASFAPKVTQRSKLSSGSFNTMPMIPPTPGDVLQNPFDNSFGTDNLGPTEDVPPVPRMPGPYTSTTNLNDASHMPRQISPTFNQTTNPTATDFATDLSPGRPRSNNVHGTAPDLDMLFMQTDDPLDAPMAEAHLHDGPHGSLFRRMSTMAQPNPNIIVH